LDKTVWDELELAVKEPLLALGVPEAGAPVVVDFEDLALRGFDSVAGAVAALPPFSAAQCALAKAIVVPAFDYVRDNILPVTEAEGSGNLNFAAYGDFNLLTKELWSHESLLA